MKRYAFGVDVGGTTIKLGLFETSGQLLELWEIPTRTEEGGRFILPDIAGTVVEKAQERNISPMDVEGVGLGVPGPVSPDGTVLKCVNLGWGVFNVERRLNALINLKVRAGNDANVAALGEMWQGAGEGHQDIVMITLGTGVGSGVIIGGRILAGVNGAAGEIGHMPMNDDETDVCSCGKRGCLEQYGSANGVVRMARHYLEDHPDVPSSLRDMECFTSKELFDEAQKGDCAALAMVEESTRELGKVCAAVACVTNPEVFVIGGGMAKAGNFLLERVVKYFQEYAFHASRDTPFLLATLGNSAGIYGGVKMLLD